ncbi:hypothetical protein [Streptomyces sp. NPDC005799]
MLSDDRTFTLQLGLTSLLQSTGAVNNSSGFADLDITGLPAGAEKG